MRRLHILTLLICSSLTFSTLSVNATDTNVEVTEETTIEDISGNDIVQEDNPDEAGVVTPSPLETETVSGNDISTWQDYKFEEADKPADGASLIYADSYNLDSTSPQDGNFVFVLASGEYKILSYNPSTNALFGTTTATGTAPADEMGNPEHEYTYETLVSYADPLSTSLDSILVNEPVKSANNYFKTCANSEAYILFFNKDATSVDGLAFVCKIADLGSYLSDRSSYSSSSASTSASSSVSLIEKIYDAGTDFCTTGKFKVTFNLGNATIAGVSAEEKALCIVIDNDFNFSLNNVTSGEVEFTLRNLENKTYNYYIKSSNGYKYEGSFAVDFVKISDSDKFEFSDATPDIKFEGYPSGSVKAGNQVRMKMVSSNVDSMMKFNGVLLGNGAYGNSFEFVVTQNGVYNYAATTEGGKVTEGELAIDFFDDTDGEEFIDPIDSKLTSAYEKGTLEQTGFGYNICLFVVAGMMCICGVALLLDRKFHFFKRLRGGSVNEEEKR